ncbi:MAG TPA: peptide ABC transporter substrate-binding protein [Woeseiaceae bacterium]|nr:peptide ABC transporter substrate-binding protein [Woeseiaceae bacterium]
MNLRAISLVAPLVVALLAGYACSSGGDGASQGDAGAPVTVRRGNGGDPQSLDPALAEGVHEFDVLGDLYEGLLALDAAGEIVPGVAESWTVGDDGLAYTFHLRDDTRWSDGAPLAADHFVTGMRRTLSPETGSPLGFLLYPIANAEAVAQGTVPASALGVAAPDPSTLVIRLHTPAPYLPSLLTMPVAYPFRDDGGPAKGRFSDPVRFVGNGAFVLADWQPGSHVRLRGNPLFREADTVTIDEVLYLPVQDPLTELTMYRAGELDITFAVPGSHVQQLRETHADELTISPYLAVYYLAFDLSEAPFDNAALRQALSMAIDRDALVRVTGRGEQPGYGLVPDGVNDYEPARYGWMSLSGEDRLARARELYAQAGYSEDEPLEVTLLYDAGDFHETIALAVSEMWRANLGVDVRLDKREWKYFLSTRNNRDEWQVMRFSWTADFDHPASFADILRSTSPQNLPGYASERYDRLLAEAEATVDPGEQMRLYAAAEAVMLLDSPIAPLYFYVSKHLVSPSISGFESNVFDRHPSRYLEKQ